MALFPNVRKALPCWAVTSLSARGRLPLTPGLFDLLVIDEASQCDIASALPLLFRAKRVVFIGDSQQLRHVSTLPPDRDRRLLEQHGLLETHHDWLYSARSLYDIAVSHVESGAVTMLRDHHRSHADIIGFSNQQFYRGDLRVATKEANLKRPRGMTKAVEWQHVAGHAERPRSGSWVNREEAAAVIGILRDLLLVRAYEGTVGVVTPFQAQGRLIEELVSRDSALAAAAARVQFLADTVHAFQGDERDTMVFSPVVSRGIEPKTYSWLNSNGNLFNVAITRARAALIVVGDRECCANCPVDYLAAFARYSGRLATPEPEHSPDQPVPEIYPTVRDPSRVSDWERAFYPHLVHLGLRPIPQYKIEQYELDFAIFHRDQKLNIEVDGQRYHADWDGELCYRDRLRNQRLIELGWTVMRFWVYELRDALPDCLARVQRWRASIDQSSPN
jgi:very-short-patch-repair endonuclease